MFDWIPNLHPIIVHFPIALVVAAVVTDVATLVLKRDADTPVLSLYAAGTIGLVAAYFTGRAAVDAVLIPPAAQAVQTDHADWALITLLVFLALTIVRVVMIRLRILDKGPSRALLAVVGLIGLGLVVVVGDLGGRMVFGYGVGVAAPQTFEGDPGTTSAGLDVESPGAVLGHSFKVVTGDFPGAILGADSTVLTVFLDREDLVFVTDETYGSVQMEVELNLDKFKGRTSALYGFSSMESSDYIKFGGGTVEQGRLTDGKSQSFDTAIHTPTGWFTLTAVSDGSHFRGYVDGAMVVHGHDDATPEGSVGLRLDGTGVVEARNLRIHRLR